MKTFKIGRYKIKNPLFLAPMVDVTNLPFRVLSRKYGAAMTYTEMIYISAIIHENRKTKEMMKIDKSERPSGIQITGNNLSEFKRVIPKIKNYNIVDLNFGCPSQRIVGNKAGSFLLKNPKKISNIISILKKGDLTVSAKIRLGFKNNNVIKISKAIEKAGADSLTVHARLAIDDYQKKADWNEIKKVKNNLGIPVIGNGDINNISSLENVLNVADGAMIGRAAIGNPLIFKKFLTYLKTNKEIDFSDKQKISSLKEYLKISKNLNFSFKEIKPVASCFFKGIPGASILRQKTLQSKSFEEIEQIAKQSGI
jgi:tRNA-dihydrouridine synthase B